MHRKKRILVAVLILCFACMLTGNNRISANRARGMVRYTVQNDIEVYYKDFTTEYALVLDAMFNSNWTVTGERSVYKEIVEHTLVHLPQDKYPDIYKEWLIEYFDSNGTKREFVLNNRGEIAEQAISHLENYVVEYYTENYFREYLNMIPFEEAVSVFDFMEFSINNPSSDERNNKHKNDSIKAYLNGFNTPQQALRLSDISPENVFAKTPYRIAISISSEIGDNNILFSMEEFEEELKNQIEDMLAAMNEFSGYTMNIEGSMRGVEDIHRWFIVNGENREGLTGYGDPYKRALYDSYIGILWE